VVRFVSSWQLWHVKNSPQHGAFTLHLPAEPHIVRASVTHEDAAWRAEERARARGAAGPKRGTRTRRGHQPPAIVLAALRVIVAECRSCTLRRLLRRHCWPTANWSTCFFFLDFVASSFGLCTADRLGWDRLAPAARARGGDAPRVGSARVPRVAAS
jgi:hypothetical protein